MEARQAKPDDLQIRSELKQHILGQPYLLLLLTQDGLLNLMGLNTHIAGNMKWKKHLTRQIDQGR
jgi:hypothetical protein